MNPANPQAVKIDIGTGAASTRSTLAVMANVAIDFSTNPSLRQFAGSLTSGLPQHDLYSEAETLSNYVRDHIRFIRDPATAELLQLPDYTLAVGYGDCDDKVTVLAALLLSIGIPVRFVAVGPNSSTYIHVFLQANINGNWVTSETAAPTPVPFGRVAPQAAALPASMIYDLTSRTITTMGAVSGHTDIRGANPYTFSGPRVTLSQLMGMKPFTVAQAQAFLTNVGAGILQTTLINDMTSVSPGQWMSVVFEGGGPWWGMQTDPAFPIPDTYWPQAPRYCVNGVPSATATGVTPKQQSNIVSGGGTRYQLQGLSGIGSMIPWTNPCTGKVQNVIDMGGGAIIIPGNTNGNDVDEVSWLYNGIINGTIRADVSWAKSQALNNFYQNNIAGPAGYFNKYAPMAIEAAVIAGVTYGFAEAGAAGVAGGSSTSTGLTAEEQASVNSEIQQEIAAQGGLAPLSPIDLSAGVFAPLDATPLVPLSLSSLGTQVGTSAALTAAEQAAEKVGLTALTAAAGVETQKLLAPVPPGQPLPQGQAQAAPAGKSSIVLWLALLGIGGAVLIH